MKLAIKFSNDYINVTEQKVGADIRIGKCVRGEMPEGAFQDGIVVNTNLVADALKKLLKEHKIKSRQAILCISGMDILQKEIKIPKSAPRHVRALLKNELVKSDALRGGYLFDYIPREEENSDGLECYSVYLLPAELIRNYEQTMRRAGVTLERVEPVSRSMEKLSQLLELQKRENSTILIDAEQTGIDFMMSGAGVKNVYRNIQIREESIEENVFIVSAIRNLGSNANPSDRVLEQLLENVSKLIQFQSQASRGRVVDQILIYGEMAADDEFVEMVAKRTGIETKRCHLPSILLHHSKDVAAEKGISYSTFGAVCGKVLGEKKQLSFIQLPDEADTMTAKDHIPLAVGLTCLIALSIYYMVTAFGNNFTEASNRELETEIARIEASEEYQRRLTLKEELIKLTAYNDSCRICIDILESTRKFETESFVAVDELVPAGIRIEGYEFEGTKVSFRCTADTQDGPADFARIVKNAEIFQDVEYTGFAAYQDTDGSTRYSFNIECIW